MWAIWWARRRAIHDEQFQSPLSTSCFITKYLQDLESVPRAKLSTARGVHVRQKELHVIPTIPQAPTAPDGRLQWLPPGAGYVKFNVDGGLSRNGKMGAAAVICRDRRGHYLGASALVLNGLTDPASLEALACNEALALAADLNVQFLHVASDCAEVVANIATQAPCRYVTILREIKHRSTSFQEVNLVHEKREHNEEAHALAKAASSLSTGRHVWLAFLPDIICIPINLQTE
jgi:ribonuclease HI